MNSVNAYLVGGAVRDKLLGFEAKDKDWVVVGRTPQEMTDLGFKQVGADFPVFLHPDTNEEYALARTERKKGHGYQGFICDSSPSITLEEDLLRRDLTINAMAMSHQGELIDPYNGHTDLKNKVLRHVSSAFSEDPLRVLRVARFYARLKPLGFTIADETLTLLEQISQSGELEHLVAERVWQETHRALSEESPCAYFEALRQTSALKVLFPELNTLFGIPQPEQHHPEIDTGIHTMMALEQATQMSKETDIRYATLVHDLGKGLTDKEILPHHYGHEVAGLKPVKKLGKRLKVPKAFQELSLLVCEFHTHVHRAFELKPQTILKVLKRCDAFRRSDRFEKILVCCKADARGRTGFENEPYHQASYFLEALAAAKRINIMEIKNTGMEGKQLGLAIDEARVNAIKGIKESFNHDK